MMTMPMDHPDGQPNAVMRQYVIYGPNQRAYPGLYVVQPWLVAAGNPEPVPERILGAVRTVRQARDLIPRRADVCLHRHPTDDPAILEVWL